MNRNRRNLWYWIVPLGVLLAHGCGKVAAAFINPDVLDCESEIYQ